MFEALIVFQELCFKNSLKNEIHCNYEKMQLIQLYTFSQDNGLGFHRDHPLARRSKKKDSKV